MSTTAFNEEEKAVMWITKRLTESHVFSVLSTVYIFASYCYDNEPVGNFKPDITRFYVHILATALALYGLGLEIYWFPPAKITDERYTFLKSNVSFIILNISFGSNPILNNNPIIDPIEHPLISFI